MKYENVRCADDDGETVSVHLRGILAGGEFSLCGDSLERGEDTTDPICCEMCLELIEFIKDFLAERAGE